MLCLDLYCVAYFGSYLHLVFHNEYTDTINLQGIGLSKISFWFLNVHLWLLSGLLTLGIRNEKDNTNDPNFFLTLNVQLCTNRTKSVLLTNCIALHMIPNMAIITKEHGYVHEKWTIRIEHNKIYIWTHGTYTKVLGCKTWNNSLPMYTSIMKLPLMWPKQILWPLYKSYDLFHKGFIY